MVSFLGSQVRQSEACSVARARFQLRSDTESGVGLHSETGSSMGLALWALPGATTFQV